MKKVLCILLTIGLCLCFTACDSSSTVREEQKYTDELMKQMSDEVGMPNISEFYEKKLAKEIFEKRDDSDLICYVYNQNLDGQYIYVGQSMGYGLPYSTQYTNPDNPYWSKYDSSSGKNYAREYTIAQADPNGLYTADGLSATWLMMVDDETGETYIMYCEPTIVVTENKIPERLIASWSLEGVDY